MNEWFTAGLLACDKDLRRSDQHVIPPFLAPSLFDVRDFLKARLKRDEAELGALLEAESDLIGQGVYTQDFVQTETSLEARWLGGGEYAPIASCSSNISGELQAYPFTLTLDPPTAEALGIDLNYYVSFESLDFSFYSVPCTYD